MKFLLPRVVALAAVALFTGPLARASSFAKAVNYPTGSAPISVVVADFNGDGKPDLAVANFNSNTLSVLLGSGGGAFKPAVDYPTAGRPISVAVGDFNGDGKPDLAVAGNDPRGTVSILLGNGDGTFMPAVDYGAGSFSRSVATADFNGDGFLDLAVANQSFDNVSILLGKGDGTFTPATNYTAGDAPVFVATADFNADGRLDLAVGNAMGASVSILLGNGDGTFQTAVNYASGGNRPESIAVKDFNGDGIPDLAAANFGSNNVGVLLGKGDGSFQTPVAYSVPAAPVSIVTADFNGDGKADLATADFDANKASVLLGNGDGTFQTAANYGAGSLPRAVAAADFNGDNAPDLAVANQKGGNVSILLNTAGTFVTTTSTPNPSTFGQPVTLATTVAAGLTGQPTPTGTVTWMNGSTQLGSAGLSSGAASLIISTLPQGSDIITTSYSGDANFNPNTAPPITQVVSGSGGPQVTLSPLSIAFPTQAVGKISPTQPVHLTNTGTAPLTISSIAASAGFLENNNCGSTVGAGVSCTINVAFKPESKGALTGSLSVTDNAPGSPQTVSLTGTGTFVELVPASLTFAPQTVGTTSPPQTITLTNLGTHQTLSIIDIAITGTNSGDFAQTNTCGTSVPPNGSCTITVTFTPKATGTRTAAVSIEDDGGGSPQVVPLMGTGM